MASRAVAKEGERKGDFLGGKYLLEDCLGIGGMGEVYRATNVSLGRKVAIKLLNKEHTSNEEDVMRFLREARAAAAVRHPNVVDVFDVARDDDGTPFIVQELLSGQDLEQHLGASGGRVPVEEALEIMIPVAEAVAAAHARDVVHRDLKPANIFLAREGNKIIPKVLDFGACLYQTVGALSAKEQRMLIGTPHYMAPEQITTAMDVDARADVWAMGVILYELLVGETPFEAEDANAVMKLVRTRSVPRLKKLMPAVPESLEEMVMRCLDRDRRKRLPDAAAVRAELVKIRKEVRPERRKRVDTDSDLSTPEAPPEPLALASRETIGESPAEPKATQGGDVEPPSHRVPSLVLKGAKTPTKRRGASLLTLSSPDEAVSWDSEPPRSASRPIEAAKAARIDPRSDPGSSRSSALEGPKPARSAGRTAADVIREADEAAAAAARASGSSAPSLPPPAPQPSPASPAPPPSRPSEQGSPRDLDLDEVDEPALDLDFEPPTSRRGDQPDKDRAGLSSIPPVLDPRAAAASGPSSKRGGEGSQRSDRPPPSSKPDPGGDKAMHASRSEARAVSLTPPLTPALRSPRTPISAVLPAAQWPAAAKASFAAAVILPALAVFVALRFAPFIVAPLGHAMRGDSPLASGVLAVLTLVGAAALAARSLGSSRSPGTLVATVGAVLLGIVMIIVTFSASETAELEIPPAAGGIVPFVAPIVPLGLGLVALARARLSWLSRYDRGEALRWVIVTSLMLLAMLELGPLGAVRAATATPTATNAPTTNAPAHPGPASAASSAP